MDENKVEEVNSLSQKYVLKNNSKNKDELCGICGCTPQCLQRFANPNAYLFFFCLLGILQGAYFTYFVGILSTLEKRYAFESKITGIILIADNLSPAIFGLCLGYYGKFAHRPRLVAVGMMVVGFSCFLSCVPYILYGPGINVTSSKISSKNQTEYELCSHPNERINCNSHQVPQTKFAVAILFIANFLNGFGSISYYTVGTPYLDDNVKEKDSPLYLGATFGLRIIGPTLGFMLSSFCLKYYENPFDDPGFTNDDPRWIGAWWIGFLILGVALILVSFPIALFPRRMKCSSDSCTYVVGDKEECQVLKQKFSDLPLALKKVAKNPILVCHTLSITFQINGIFGYYVFMPKYIESQYHQTASSANFFSGTTSMLTMICGIFLGGILIRKFKPRPRYLTGYMVFVELFAGVGLIASLMFGCPSFQISEMSKNFEKTYNPHNTCNQGCGCSTSVFHPVCDSRHTVYFSPCFAGCSSYNKINNLKVFENCSCTVYQDFNTTSIKSEYCSDDCNMFLPYIIVLTLSKIFSSTARVGNVLVTLRCVDSEDKTLALGAVEFIISIFATIPYPLIYGSVIDTACLIWEENCGKRGNCWLYDKDRFRHYFHVLSITFIFVGTCFDFVVFYMSNRIKDFYGKKCVDIKDDDVKDRQEKELLNLGEGVAVIN